MIATTAGHEIAPLVACTNGIATVVTTVTVTIFEEKLVCMQAHAVNATTRSIGLISFKIGLSTFIK